MRQLLIFACLVSLPALSSLSAAEVEVGGRLFRIPDGFELTLAATQPVVDRPITAAFDEQGYLYVADSSGSNDNVQKQLEERPHRILRLEDTNDDGQFDKSIVFADRMMFPEGTMWYDGSLYVSAPPSIWKLTDTNNDGVADQREEWFDAKTLTGCANDLHGPYLGLDGWIYWCKGAFAEQRYERPGKSPLVTRAAHIFRRRPEGGLVEPVMNGGMDNPVDVVFTRTGERIFTTTFLQHPRGGQRDGLIHALYGGLYGKVHSVLDGHARTGELLSPLVHLGAAAPSGLHRLDSAEFGDDYQDNLFAALFNMQKVTRHALRKSGSTFEATNEDFVATDDIDFHPTDVLEDADGSLLIVDTGGWYKLCCPTSQLHKPDVLGDIYRIRRKGSHRVSDPRGKSIAWSAADSQTLVGLLGDERPAVRSRAKHLLAGQGSAAVTALGSALSDETVSTRLEAVWTLCSMKGDSARRLVRSALADKHHDVQQAALHAVSVHRDHAAVDDVIGLLEVGSAQVKRAAAEALGRLGDARAVPALLRAVTLDCDRSLEHSLIYALVELDLPQATLAGFQGQSATVRRAALIAVDQMESGKLTPGQIEPLLDSDQAPLRDVAWWLVDHHPEWAGELVGYVRKSTAGKATTGKLEMVRDRLPGLLANSAVAEVIFEQLQAASSGPPLKLAILDAVAASTLEEWPADRFDTLVELLRSQEASLVRSAVAVVHHLEKTQPKKRVVAALMEVATRPELEVESRLKSMAVASRGTLTPSTEMHAFVCKQLAADQPPAFRALAVEVLQSTPLDSTKLATLAAAIPSVGPLELGQLLDLFHQSPTAEVAESFIAALQQCPAAAALSQERVAECLEPFPSSISESKQALFDTLAAAQREKLQQIDRVVALLDEADIRRGQSVFNSAKASCKACHEMGYLGGNVGPDLTRIGRIRTERDLLEAILFPSVSFVRSYEPVEVLTSHGKLISGLIRDETSEELVLAIDAQKVERIPHADIEMRRPGRVSVMPAGLDKQLTPLELADLVKFLRAAR